MNEYEFNKLINLIKIKSKNKKFKYFRIYIIYDNDTSEFRLFEENSNGGSVYSNSFAEINTTDEELIHKIIKSIMEMGIRVATTFDHSTVVNLKSADDFHI